MIRAHQRRVSHGAKSATPPAPRRQSAPTHPACFLTTLTTLPPPPLRLERAQREEQRERDRREVVHEVLGVDQAAAEGIHVLSDREVLEHRAEGAAGELRAPSDDPERQQHPEGSESRYDLVLGQRGDQEPHREERATGQDQAEVAGEHRPPLDAGEVRDDPRIEQRQDEQQDVQDQGGHVLPRHDLAVAHRVRQQELDRAGLLLLGEQPHRHHRQEEQQDHAHVREQRPHHVLGDVEVLAHAGLHERPHRDVAVVQEDLAEEPAGDQQEEGEDDIGHRGAEVQPHLLLENGQPAHQRSSGAAGASSTATASPATTGASDDSSPATTRMKTSSRLMPTWCNSLSAQPRLSTSEARSLRTSRSRAASTRNPCTPSREGRSSTLSTAGTARSACATSPLAPATRTSTRAAGKTCSTSSVSVPCATMRPRLMMITPSHTIDTSGRMCVDRMTVCWPASERMSARISAICFGSRPMVGSSRISTSGSPRSAWASPTRWR